MQVASEHAVMLCTVVKCTMVKSELYSSNQNKNGVMDGVGRAILLCSHLTDINIFLVQNVDCRTFQEADKKTSSLKFYSPASFLSCLSYGCKILLNQIMCRSLKLFSRRCRLKCNFTKSFRLRDEKLKLRIRFFFFFSCHHPILSATSTLFSPFL